MQCNRILAFVGVMLAVSGSGLVAGAQNAPRTGSFGGAHSGTATGKMNGMHSMGMGSIVGNKKTHVYHMAGDKSTLPAEKNRAYFQTEAQAMAAGYHAAGQKKSATTGGKMTGGMPSTTPLHPGMKH